MNSSNPTSPESLKGAVDRDPARIEREIGRTRERLDQDLDALETKFSPGQLLDNALEYVKRNGGEFAANLGHQVKGNPVPLILTGVGLIWLMSSRNGTQGSPARAAPFDTVASDMDAPGRLEAAQEAMRDGAEHVGTKVRAAADRLSESGAQVTESVRGTARVAYERTAALGESIRQQTGRLTESSARLMREQPLVMGLVGLAVGALVGTLLPSTETEDRMMGAASDQLVEAGKGAARDAIDAAQEAVNAATQPNPGTADAPRAH